VAPSPTTAPSPLSTLHLIDQLSHVSLFQKSSCFLAPPPFLSHSQLLALPSTVFAALSSIQFLDLTFNNLTSVPGGVFSNLRHLRGLSLAANLLVGSSLVTDSFSGLSSLEVRGRVA
jgi:Leucine-rich repeat (LRR) protein